MDKEANVSVLWGALGGLLSSAIAHAATMFADRNLGSSSWLQGPNGPPFFNIALFMGLMYGGIAFSIKKRPSSLLGFFGPFLAITLPLAAASRLLHWPEGTKGLIPNSPSPWYDLVLGDYILAVWGSIFLIGWGLGSSMKAGVFAVMGALLAFGALTLTGKAAPSLFNFPWRPGYLPQPQVLLDGLLTGAGIALGGLYAQRHD